jgi:hypothetical protein
MSLAGYRFKRYEDIGLALHKHQVAASRPSHDGGFDAIEAAVATPPYLSLKFVARAGLSSADWAALEQYLGLASDILQLPQAPNICVHFHAPAAMSFRQPARFCILDTASRLSGMRSDWPLARHVQKAHENE